MKYMPLLASLCLVSSTFQAQVSLSGTTPSTPPCIPSVTLTGIPSATDCFSLSASVLHPGAPDSYYSWDFGDATPNKTGRSLNHCYASETAPGNTTRTVTLSYFNPVLNCGGSTTATLNVSVIPASPCLNVPPPYTRSVATVTVWSGSLIPEMVTRYDFGDGSGTASGNVHTYAACGNYIVRTSSWDMNTPNQVCHSFVAVNLGCAAVTGVHELSQAVQVSVFPNPASGQLRVRTDIPVASLVVTDAAGRTVISEKPSNAAEPVLEISQLAPGTYFLALGFESGARKTLLFVRE